MKKNIQPNGLLLVYEKLSDVQYITVSLYVRAGLIYEEKKSRGISHLVEHMLFRSLGGIEQEELYRKMRKMGTVMRAITYYDCIKFEISVVPEFYHEALNLILLTFKEQIWTHKEIAAEKRVVLKQIEFSGISFSKYAQALCYNCFPWDYPIMGYPSSVNKISRDNLLAWHRKIFQPCNACIVVSGAVTESDIESLTRATDDAENRCEPLMLLPFVPSPMFHRGLQSDKIIDVDYETVDVSVSFDIEKQYNDFAEAFYYILGPDVTSPLSVALREKYSLTDEVEVFFENHHDFSRLCFEFSVSAEDLVQSVEMFFTELKNELKNLEMENCNVLTQYFKKQKVTIAGSLSELNDSLGWGLFVNRSSEKCTLNAEIEFSLSQLKEAADKIFCKENLMIVSTVNTRCFKKSAIAELFKNIRNTL